MAIVKFKLDPANPPKLPAKVKRAHDAMTDEQITAAALSDPDNPPLTDEEIDRFTAVRLAKQARQKLSLTQREFSERYHIKFGRLRDIERGRCVRPDTALIAYLRVINEAAETVDAVLRKT
jgi:putative transcriptional regulator